ncbi:SGNH/GDSL hydrolase family protein [Rhodococcus sp. IEGM 1408]|uniref:SGNH/GDSL hydrolase family protein n=1 Tax=Rhodococcus sp. IEGM 1408 TaxID=3082220 RepID=UPI002953A39A|nr:GDSL-type esterase/lipase family protein [Rhodococcus sp. IEGM 1408]MDV8000972.1 GDSL-type esterase/lipase family protein [Rhodococcus sp. IEGM 1408]
MSEPRDLPVCVIGDSFVAGYGDETGRGWTALLVEEGSRAGLRLRFMVAGIGGDTSQMILARWDEVDRRRAAFPTTAVIAEFGVNDVMEHEGAVRVDEAGTVAALRGMIARTPEGRLLVVGPPPVVWDGVNERITARAAAMAEVCAEAGVPFVPTFDRLLAGGAWMREVTAGDGAHPGPAGYEEFARVVAGPVLEWLRSLADVELGWR